MNARISLTKKDMNAERALLNAVDAEAICIYFYYFKLDQTTFAIQEARAYFDFDFYEKPFSAGDLVNTVLRLAGNAYSDGPDPASHGSKLSDLTWRRKSYLMIAIDAGGKYVDPGNPITFKGRVNSVDNDGKHTFPTTELINVNVFDDNGNPVPIEVISTQNTMRSKTHHTNLGIDEREAFEVYINQKQGGVAPLTVPDSGGTNLGPPVPPPAFTGSLIAPA